MPCFATYDTTVVNVEPETERKGDSCASARNVTAGVDVSHSSQGNEATELDGDRQECVFCFVPRVKPVLGSSGCVKGRMLTREILGSGRINMINMRGAWRHPLHVRKKEMAMCRDHIDGTVVHMLR